MRFAKFDNHYSEISGFYDARDSKEIMYVNNEELPARQMLTIAHELGPKFLHEEWLKSSQYKVLYQKQLNDLSLEKDPKKQEADCFAAHLLAPKFILDKYRDVATIDDLSTLFVVSRPVIQNRLSSLVHER